MVGPPLQNDLFNILLRFRQHQFVIKADIEKMYRQVLIEDNQKQYQKIFWRSDVSQPVKVYKLNTVTYGTSSAPFLAIRFLNQVALDHFQNDPVISNIINNDFYVDDLLTGAETIDSVVQIRNKLTAVLATVGFNLRKIIQNTEFKRAIQELVRNKQIHKSSNLLSLNPFLDKDNILRVGGRIRHSNVNLDQKDPIVIPGSHHVTKLIIEQEHKRLMHGGTGVTLSPIRCKYWPVSGRNSVRQVLRLPVIAPTPKQ
jgi:hypothetical protein